MEALVGIGTLALAIATFALAWAALRNMAARAPLVDWRVRVAKLPLTSYLSEYEIPSYKVSQELGGNDSDRYD